MGEKAFRLAVVSDVHGNAEALRQVLADMDHLGVAEAVCLGDAIGYGPEPEASVGLLRERGVPMVMGNHEQALSDPRCLDWFNPLARAALIKTRTMLRPQTIDYLSGLPRFLVRRGCRFVHGFPPDSLRIYLHDKGRAEIMAAFLEYPEDICFVGHTHELALISFDGSRLERGPLGRGARRLDASRRHLVNAGSVGQPRDGDNRAKYVLWDPEARVLEVRFVAYDIKRTADLIIELGLPGVYADKLW
ncbi:MAG: metallophosphoesterase family protein [Desulfovibrionaceae bacterium]|nr:metallophosphoesterase [Desulfovibrionaceae bacterium]MDD4952196.1 metallophosphoesterase family protein [Desulfovibrionaceae bacterium]